MQQFHLIANRNDKNRVFQYAIERKKSISKIVRMMINNTYWFLEKNQYRLKDFQNRYEFCEGNCHVFINLETEQYKKLKQVHDVNQFFSIAQILRGIILFYLDGIERFGEKGFEELLKENQQKFRKWEMEWNKKPHMRLKKKLHYQLLFDTKNKLIGIIKNLS